MLGKTKIHYAWVIMIACFIFYAALVGTCYNCRGLFYTAISEGMGWKYSSVTFSSLLMGLSAVAALKIVPYFFEKYPIKWVLVITGGLYAVTYILRAFMTSIITFCILSVFMGALSAFIIFVPLPLIINNWFLKSKGFALGFASLASGAGATIASPILSRWITEWGWQKAAIMNGAVAAAIAIPVILIFIEGKPREKKMIPYGAPDNYEELIKNKNADTEKSDTGKSGAKSLDKSQHQLHSDVPAQHKKKLLILCIIYAVLIQLIAGFTVQMSDIAFTLGMSLVIGGLLNSVCNVGNIFGKAAGGFSMDHIGTRKTLVIVLIVTALGLGAFIIGSESVALLCIGAFGIGIAAVGSTVAPAAMIDTFSKGNEYVKNMAMISMGTMLASSFTSYLPGLVRDATGSYLPVYLLYLIFTAVSLVIVLIVLKGKE